MMTDNKEKILKDLTSIRQNLHKTDEITINQKDQQIIVKRENAYKLMQILECWIASGTIDAKDFQGKSLDI